MEIIIRSHSPQTLLDSVEEVEPTPEEIEILNAYKNGDERYQPSISHKTLKKELGL